MERWTKSGGYLNGLRATLGAGPPAGDDPDTKRIADWLANLWRLNGVPFAYLVPDERMLPPESIRFFWLDDDWLTCLIDGAFSLGRSTSGDEEREQDAVAGLTERATTAGPVTGFLLRSAVVAGWPGLEVRAYAAADKKTVRDPVRIERLADDVLFCSFHGEVGCVTISEPAQTLHFGFLAPDVAGGDYEKQLKYVDAEGHVPGTLIPDVHVTPRFRAGDRRVVDVLGLKDDVHGTLVSSGGIGDGAPYTPAEFALELVEGVEEVDFVNPGSGS